MTRTDIAELEARQARRERIMWPALIGQSVLCVVLQALAIAKVAEVFWPLLVVWAVVVIVFVWAITTCFRMQGQIRRLRAEAASAPLLTLSNALTEGGTRGATS